MIVYNRFIYIYWVWYVNYGKDEKLFFVVMDC